MFQAIKQFLQPTIPDSVATELDKQLAEVAIPFGSQVWGGATNKSDYDFLIRVKDFDKLRLLLEINKVSLDFSDMYKKTLHNSDEVQFAINGKKYQLIMYYSLDNFDNFKSAIHLMSAYLSEPLVDKKARIACFENFYFFTTHKALTLNNDINKFLMDAHPEVFI